MCLKMIEKGVMFTIKLYVSKAYSLITLHDKINHNIWIVYRILLHIDFPVKILIISCWLFPACFTEWQIKTKPSRFKKALNKCLLKSTSFFPTNNVFKRRQKYPTYSSRLIKNLPYELSCLESVLISDANHIFRSRTINTM